MSLDRLPAIVFHPVVPGFVVALATSIEHEGGLTTRLILVAAIVSAVCLGLPGVAVAVLYATGRLGRDVYLVDRKNRRYLYPVLLVSLGISAAIFTWYYPFPLARTMTIAAVIVSGTMAVANRWLKPSIHCAGNASIGVATAWVHGIWGVPFVLIVPLVAWSRVRTKNHTFVETIVGTAIGVALTAAACLILLGLPDCLRSGL